MTQQDFEEQIKIAPFFVRVAEGEFEISEEETNRSMVEAVHLGGGSWVYKGYLYLYQSEDKNARNIVMSYHWTRSVIRMYLIERRDQIGIERVDQIIRSVPESFIENLSTEISSIVSWSRELTILVERYFFAKIADACANKTDVNEILGIVNRAKEIYGVDLDSKNLEVDEKILEELS